MKMASDGISQMAHGSYLKRFRESVEEMAYKRFISSKRRGGVGFLPSASGGPRQEM